MAPRGGAPRKASSNHPSHKRQRLLFQSPSPASEIRAHTAEFECPWCSATYMSAFAVQQHEPRCSRNATAAAEPPSDPASTLSRSKQLEPACTERGGPEQQQLQQQQQLQPTPPQQSAQLMRLRPPPPPPPNGRHTIPNFISEAEEERLLAALQVDNLSSWNVRGVSCSSYSKNLSHQI